MRVLQIANDYLNTTLYKELFTSLKKQTCDSIVFVPVANDSTFERDDIFVVPCYNKYERLLFFPKQRKIIKAIEKHTDWLDVDLIHAHTLFSAGYSARYFKKKYGIPFVVAIRNVDVNVFLKKLALFRVIGLMILLDADKVIFLSKSYRDLVIEKYVPQKYRKIVLDKSEIIPNGINRYWLENKNATKRSDNSNIELVFAGEINKNKNILIIQEAIELLVKEGYTASLSIAGKISDQVEFEKIVANNNTKYYGQLNKEGLLELFRNSDIFIMVSHTESFGLVYAEAMTQGLPVIYSKGQGFDGQFPDGVVGFSAVNTDAQDLANKIIRTINNYEIISKNAICHSSDFDWEIISNDYVKVYKSIGK